MKDYKMRERPILFNTQMVQAILAGKKTHTRRVIDFKRLSKIKQGRLFYSTTFDSWAIEDKGSNPESDIELVECPKGKPGDQLWVRETFSLGTSVMYKADSAAFILAGVKWKPSIFMPRWASRIQLLIKSVNVECIQDITEEGARAEGIIVDGCARDVFAHLWNSINEKRGFGWTMNPWVWDIGFEVIKKENKEE